MSNENRTLSDGDGITVREYGQYAIVESVASGVFDDLKGRFHVKRTAHIFCFAAILAANGFVHMYMDQVGALYEQNSISLSYGK